MIYTCDECLRGPLKTKRYRCQTCPEFDLCQKCFDLKRHQEDGHKFACFAIELDANEMSDLEGVEEGGEGEGNDDDDREEEGAVNDSRVIEEGDYIPFPPPRQRKSTTVDSVERMDALLTRIQIKLPISQISSNSSVQFLDLFEQSGDCLKQSKSKKVKVMEQILARTALQLVGAKLRKTANTLKLVSPEPELVFTLMKGLLSQLLIFNQTVGEKTEQVRKEVDRNTSGKLPFASFYSQTWDALNLAMRDQPKASKLSLAALEELKEALGFEDLRTPATPAKSSASEAAAAASSSSSSLGKKKPKAAVVAVAEKTDKPSSKRTSKADVVVDDKKSTPNDNEDKPASKRARVSGTVAAPMVIVFPPAAAVAAAATKLAATAKLTPVASKPASVASKPAPVASKPTPVKPAPIAATKPPPPAATTTTTVIEEPPMALEESPFDIIAKADQAMDNMSVEAEEILIVVGHMRDELCDLHGRIDVLVHLLREGIGAPMQRALERLSAL
ncbi:hypothetical protein BASA81_005172 [Batrachochytrium salamandrivorans]|nr:hypothetical protein BASA81_005172 [Batrachochytrium salamandrivorans]